MSQTVEPNPYPPTSEIVVFFGKFAISGSFLIAFLFILTNIITVTGYSDQFFAFLPATILLYVIAGILAYIGTVLVSNIGKNKLGWEEKGKNSAMIKSYRYVGFLVFLFLSVYQYYFQMPNYEVLKDPYLLTGFAWTFVLYWWLLSFSLGTYAIVLFILNKKFQ